MCSFVAKSSPTLCDPRYCRTPGSSVHGISQARILEWVAVSSSRTSSRPRDQTHVSCIGQWILYHWAITLLNRLFTSFPVQWSGEELLVLWRFKTTFPGQILEVVLWQLSQFLQWSLGYLCFLSFPESFLATCVIEKHSFFFFLMILKPNRIYEYIVIPPLPAKFEFPSFHLD